MVNGRILTLVVSLADAHCKVFGYGTCVGCKEEELLILCGSGGKRDAVVPAAAVKVLT